MQKQFPKVLIVFVLIGILTCLGGIFTGCGSSDKDKAMAVADKLEKLVDEYADKIKEKRDAQDMEGMGAVMEEFQKESMNLVKELEGMKGNLSDKDKQEVEKRFHEVGEKMLNMMQM